MRLRSWLKKLVLYFSCIRCFAETETEPEKCLTTEGKTEVVRHFYVGEYELPLRIEVSNRLTHKLVSQIAQIFLQEAVGYPYVHLIEQDPLIKDENATRTLQKISSCNDPTDCQEVDVYGPEIMINLEVWLHPGFDREKWIATGRVEDLGAIGPIGSSGWFIAQYTVEYFWESNNTIIDHWRAFTNPDIVKHFDLTGEEAVLEKLEKTEHYCKFKGCVKGIYIPEQCLNNRCATILADYPASNFKLLEYAIRKYKLLVNIAWLGKNLEDVVVKRTVNDKKTLFFHKKPMFLSSLGNYVHVSFPDCEDDKEASCAFEISQLEKVVWSKVKTEAPHAFHILKAIHFSEEDYLELMKKYNQDFSRGWSIWQSACDWIRTHLFVWSSWLPLDAGKVTTLFIGGIFPLTGVYRRQGSVLPAALMAADAINNNSSLLPNYEIQILQQDGQCATDEVVKSFINYVTNATAYKTMVGILGPACSDTVEPIVGVAKYFSTIIISYSAEGALFSREKYPLFFRTIPENNQFKYVYLKLFETLGYTRVAALTEDGRKYPEYISHLQDLMQVRKMSFIVNRKFPRDRETLVMRPYLEDLKEKGARIIIGDFYDYAAKAVMCEAYKLGMTAAEGYVWFLPLWFSSNWLETSRMDSDGYGHVNCTAAELFEAMNGHFSLAYKFYADDNSIMQEGKTVSSWLKQYHEKARKNKMEISHYGGYAYDAVWVYARALDALFKENNSHIATLHTLKTSRRLAELVNETNFNGVSGPLYFVGSSRISDVIIWQWLDNKTEKVGVYHPSSQTEGELEFNETNVVWLTRNGRKPSDGVIKEMGSCSVEGFRKMLGVNCEVAMITVNVIALSAFAVFIVTGTFYFKRRYDKRMKRTEARMKELGLVANTGPLALDEWEMPRDQIVINRKLGEGAFGTVFGGEAKVQNQGWIAVAVKTLKNGAKPDEKLDFLGEAEVMKQFDHINIVKLVGVCTMGEPVYTVMEFMLYGDLKTYLLSRRNLAAAEKDRTNNDEVSDKRLTNMALDIARGLSYLADKKFVHRDLACRNCLVNISRSVKIADFGMCRAMYDSDYYRYNKKGMLPVRWMAPESLTDGLFTPMSDVWSYGVVLYEIVTFASVPYQGLSNSQVLEHIKRFKTLPVPKGVRPKLNSLLLQCWSRFPQERPHAAEIVEILAQNPELVTPCLDLPPSAVEMADSGTLELANRDRARVHSLSSVWQPRKTAIHDQTQIGLFETTRMPVNSRENLIKHSGLKFSRNKFAFHESFRKKSKKESSKDKYCDSMPQSTDL